MAVLLAFLFIGGWVQAHNDNWDCIGPPPHLTRSCPVDDSRARRVSVPSAIVAGVSL